MTRTMVLQLSLALVAACFALTMWDLETALAVLAAGLVSTVDLGIMGLAAARLSQERVRSRIFYTVALGIKFPALIAVVYLLVAVLKLNPLGLIIGFSTLVVAILYAAVSFQKSLVEGERA
jgi:hypothetical protein